MMSTKQPKTTKSKRKGKETQSELVASLTHSLRNPLGVVVFSTMLLERELAQEPAKKRHLDALKRAAQEMTSLLEDYGDCVQIEANELVLAQDPIEPQAILREAIEQARQTLAGRSIEVRAAIEADLKTVRGDKTRLLQALARVVEDAARFMPEGGTITLGAEKTNAGVRLFVSDTGPALPLADRELVFQREVPRERKGCRGTGLRMFIAKGIIEAMGGSAALIEREDASNTVALTLPKASKATKRLKRSS